MKTKKNQALRGAKPENGVAKRTIFAGNGGKKYIHKASGGRCSLRETAGIGGELMRLEQVAAMLGVSPATVCTMVGDGMPCVRKARRGAVLFREREVRSWLARKPKLEIEVPEVDEDGLVKGTDRAGVFVAGVLFALMAAGMIYGVIAG